MSPEKILLLFTLAVFGLFLMLSCTTNKNNIITYYKLKEADFNHIPIAYKAPNKLVYFKNKSNKIISFKVNYFTISKHKYVEGRFDFKAPEIYYYDKLRISLSPLDVKNEHHKDDDNENYDENKFRCEAIIIEISKGKNTLLQKVMLPLSHGLDTKHLCMKRENRFRVPAASAYDTTTTMVIHGNTYHKVRVLKTEKMHYFSLYNNVEIHNVYYDFKKGLLGFDTSENLQYRIVL